MSKFSFSFTCCLRRVLPVALCLLVGAAASRALAQPPVPLVPPVPPVNATAGAPELKQLKLRFYVTSPNPYGVAYPLSTDYDQDNRPALLRSTLNQIVLHGSLHPDSIDCQIQLTQGTGLGKPIPVIVPNTITDFTAAAQYLRVQSTWRLENPLDSIKLNGAPNSLVTSYGTATVAPQYFWDPVNFPGETDPGLGLKTSLSYSSTLPPLGSGVLRGDKLT